jgi:hypothetical protein
MMIVPTADPNLQEILEEQLRLEKLRAVRVFLLTVLAFLGVFVWVAAVWFRSARAWGALFALVTWPACFAGFILACALEQRAERRLEGLLNDGNPRES